MTILEVDPANNSDILAWLAKHEELLPKGFSAIFPSDKTQWSKALDTIVVAARKARFPAGIELETLAFVHFYAEIEDSLKPWRNDILEKSLLALWYWLLSEYADEGEEEAVAAWLEKLALYRTASKEASLRRMAVWLRFKLMERREANTEIEVYVRSLRDSEREESVWKGIVTFLSTWSGTWRIFGDLHSWEELRKIESDDRLEIVRRGQAAEYSLALDIVQGYRESLPRLVAAVAAEKMGPDSITWIFTSHAERGFDFPMDLDAFRELCVDPASRSLAIYWLGRYAELAPRGRPRDEVLEALAHEASPTFGILDIIASAFARSELARRQASYSAALSLLLSFANEPLAALPLAATSDLYIKLTPQACALLADAPSLDIVEPVLGLLASESSYIRAIGVDILRTAQIPLDSRGTLALALRRVLEAHPSTQGFLETQGADLAQGSPANPFALPDPLAFIDAGGQGQGTIDAILKDRVKSLALRAELNEKNVVANTAYRSAALLKESAELTNNEELITWLRDFADINRAIGD